MKINADRKTIENLPPHVLSNLGLNQIAYVRKDHETPDDYLVYGADGQVLYTCETLKDAEEHIKMNNMMLITLH